MVGSPLFMLVLVMIVCCVSSSQAMSTHSRNTDSTHKQPPTHDHVNHYTPSKTSVHLMVAPMRTEFRMHEAATGDRRHPAVAKLTSGGFVSVWVECTSSAASINGRMYDALGYPTTSDIVISADLGTSGDISASTGIYYPVVSGLDNGGFMVMYPYRYYNGFTEKYKIYVRIYNAAGEPDTNGFDGATGDDASNSYSVSMVKLAGGNIVATWRAEWANLDGTVASVWFKVYSPTGGAVSSGIRVDPTGSTTYTKALTPAVAALTDGAFVVVFCGELSTTDQNIYGHIYLADGSTTTSDFTVNDLTTYQQTAPQVAGLSGGGFVVVWTDAASDGGSYPSVYARIYGSAPTYTAAGASFIVNTAASVGDYQVQPYVTAMPDGGFVVVFSSGGSDGVYNIYARIYNADLSPSGAEFITNTYTTGNQATPVVTSFGNGTSLNKVVVAWASSGQDGSTTGIYAQMLHGVNAPTVSGVTKTRAEDNSILFATSDFNTDYVSVRGAALVHIDILSLPSNGGVLKLNGNPCTVGQEIAASYLPNIQFVPTADWYGTTSFQWTVYDGTHPSLPVETTIEITSVNDIGTSTSFSRTINEDTSLTFALADFALVDVETATPTQVKVVTLPTVASGVLTLSGVNVTANQVITAANIPSLVFTPTIHWCGSASFTWAAYDGAAYTSNTATATITVTAVNDAPVATAFTKTINEDTSLTYALGDFIITDVEGSTMTGIKIITPPTDGTLTLSGIGVSSGQTVASGLLGTGMLVYTPTANYYGTTYWQWQGCDGELYSVTVNANIVVSPVNDPPTSVAFSKTAAEDMDVVYSASDFVITDTDGDVVSKITIVTLPPSADGVIKVAGVAITTENYVVNRADISSMVFNPTANWHGTTSFTWKGNDGVVYSTNVVTATIIITSVDDPPVPTAFTKTGQEDTTMTFSTGDFQCTDVESDPLTKIRIASLPEHGVLKLLGNVVVSSQEIAVADISSLSFIPDADWNGNTQFTWKAGTGTPIQYSTNVAAVNLIVTAVKDAPRIAGMAKELNADQTLQFTSDDFTTGFSDPDSGDQLASIRITLLPSGTSGVLRLNGQLVAQGQTITAANLQYMTFVPTTGYTGSTTFQYTVSDGDLSSSEAATCQIVIVVTTAPPTTTAAPKVAGFSLTTIISSTVGGGVGVVTIVSLSVKFVIPFARGKLKRSNNAKIHPVAHRIKAMLNIPGVGDFETSLTGIEFRKKIDKICNKLMAKGYAVGVDNEASLYALRDAILKSVSKSTAGGWGRPTVRVSELNVDRIVECYTQRLYASQPGQVAPAPCNTIELPTVTPGETTSPTATGLPTTIPASSHHGGEGEGVPLHEEDV